MRTENIAMRSIVFKQHFTIWRTNVLQTQQKNIALIILKL
jgi:hypothetical protein